MVSKKEHIEHESLSSSESETLKPRFVTPLAKSSNKECPSGGNGYHLDAIATPLNEILLTEAQPQIEDLKL